MTSQLKSWHKELLKAGWFIKRDNGGHIVYGHPDGRTFVMPSPVRKRNEGRGSNHDSHIRRQLRHLGVDV